jgi:hypothetical protein
MSFLWVVGSGQWAVGSGQRAAAVAPERQSGRCHVKVNLLELGGLSTSWLATQLPASHWSRMRVRQKRCQGADLENL